MIYKRTYELISQGENFYSALHRATQEDARGFKPGDFWQIPSWVRHPFIFKVWSFIGAPNSVYLFALFLVVLSLFLMGIKIEKILFPGSSLALSLFLYPYFYLAASWENLWNPDLWSAILVLLSFSLLVSDMQIPAVLSAFFAALTRIHALAWLGLVVLYVIHRSIGERRYLYGIALVLAGIFAYVLYKLHWQKVATEHAYLVKSVASGLGTRTKWNGWDNFITQLNWRANFVTTTYTFHHYYAGILILPGIVGLTYFATRLIEDKNDSLAGSFLLALIYTIGMAFYTSIQTLKSQYWGVHFMPFVLLGVAMLLLSFFKRLNPEPMK